MIILEQVTKFVSIRGETMQILSSASVNIPSDRRIALLGPSERDKDVVVNLLTGQMLPSAGRIVRKAHVSFPVGQLPGLARELSLRRNVAHVARLYGADVRQTVEFVQSVLDVGEYFDKPYIKLTPRMRKPFAQILGFSIPFDTYVLADDKLRGEREFKEKCYAAFQARARTSGMIIPISNQRFAREYCDMSLVVHQGKLRLFETV